MRRETFEALPAPKKIILKKISYATLFLSLYSIIFFTPVLLDVYRHEDKANFRYLLSDGHHPYINPSLLNSMAGIIATFYIIPICLGLYNLASKNVKLGILLILSSLSYPVFLLSYLGRDGVLFWLISFTIALIGIKKSFGDEAQKKLRFSIGSVVLVFTIAFLYITIHRFGSAAAAMSIADYFGQPIINLSKVYGETLPPANGAISNAPIYDMILGNFTEERLIYLKLDRLDSPIWVFGTYLKQMYLDYGTLGTICIISAFSFISIFYTRKSKDLGTYIFYVFYTTFVVQSIFYFRHYNNAGHIYLTFMFAICAIISLMSAKNSINTHHQKNQTVI